MDPQQEVLINEDASAFLLPGVNAVVLNKTVDKQNRPDVTIKKASSDTAKGNIAIWGEDNLFPQNVLTAIRSNTIVPSTLDWKARALYSGGLMYGISTLDEEGKEVFKRTKDPVVDDFLKKSNMLGYFIQAPGDFYRFYNAFPELTLSKDRKSIVQLSAQKAAHCRWGLQNKKGVVDKCFIHADWANNPSETDTNMITRPVLDLFYDPVNALKERTDSFNYIYPLSYPTANESYYALADWYSLVTSGWLDCANAIAKFKKYLMENQITVKYLIKVPEYWWQWKYSKWDKMSDDEKNAAKKTELKAFNDFLTGPSKAGMSIMTTFKFDPIAKVEYPGWIIEAIDDKIKDGIYVEDSQEASSHILYALGVDFTLIGSVPGSGLGAGSGSDKREAFNMYMSLCKIHEDLILAPLHFIRDYNGWNPDLVFKFERPYLQTLDKIAPAQRNTAPGGAQA